ncbi:MAG: P-II family nitrogen regulator [Magnetococcales bacterium]|nr:P-II family nitrogen regulator [Magnetococcales bacterium]
MDFQILIVTVKSDLTEKIVKAAKQAGAPGSTVMPAHGTGIYEAKTFFGLDLDIASDVIMFILKEKLVDGVLQAINTAGNFDKPGTGVAFVIPAIKTLGLQSQVMHYKKDGQ